VCAALPVIGAAVSAVGGIMAAQQQRRAIAAKNRADRIAHNNRMRIKIAKHNESLVNLAKTQDANKAGLVANLGQEQLNLFGQRAELSQSQSKGIIKAFRSAGGIETSGNLGRKLQNASWMEEGQRMSNAAQQFTTSLGQSELRADQNIAQYNANIKTGNPLILEQAPTPRSMPSLLPSLLSGAGDVFSAWDIKQGGLTKP